MTEAMYRDTGCPQAGFAGDGLVSPGKAWPPRGQWGRWCMCISARHAAGGRWGTAASGEALDHEGVMRRKDLRAARSFTLAYPRAAENACAESPDAFRRGGCPLMASAAGAGCSVAMYIDAGGVLALGAVTHAAGGGARVVPASSSLGGAARHRRNSWHPIAAAGDGGHTAGAIGGLLVEGAAVPERILLIIVMRIASRGVLDSLGFCCVASHWFGCRSWWRCFTARPRAGGNAPFCSGANGSYYRTLTP